MLRKLIHPGGVKSAEVVETKRPAVHLPSVILEGQYSLLQIPVGDVQRRIAQDADFISEARDKVHELLIDKNARVLRVDALVLQPSCPPSEDRICLRASMNAKEA